MGILKNVALRAVGAVWGAEARASLENPRVSLDDPEMIDALLGEDGPSASGVRVGPESALRLSPVWRGVFLVANTVAKLPLYVYERDADGEGKHFATAHPAYPLLRRKPNPELLAFTFKQVITAQAILRGNGYAWIDRRGDGSPLEMINLPPGSCSPVRVDGELWYVYTPPGGGQPRKLRAEDVYHVRGPGLDALCGINLTGKAGDSMGSGLAAQQYAAAWYRNGAEPRVVFETTQNLTDKQRKAIREGWQSMHGGLDNVHKTALLEKGVSIKTYGADPESSQLLETRKFTPIDVANWLGIPPHKVGETTRTAFASLEQENQSFLDDAIEPWLVQHEEQAWDKLLTEEQKARDTHTVEFMRQALMRADSAARSTYYHNALIDGWMNYDEVRARENLNPMPDGTGKVHYRQANMVPVGGEKDAEEAKFLREAWLGFQADGTVADVAANLTDIKALTAAVGLPVNEEYVEPWLPVVADAGPLVSGDVVTDDEGDVVGGDVLPAASDGGGGGGGEGADVQDDQVGEGGDAAARSHRKTKQRRHQHQRRGKQKKGDAAQAAHERMVTLYAATRQALLDVVRRMVGRVASHAEKAARGGTLKEFLAGGIDRGIDRHRAVMVEAIAPALAACAAARGVRADAGLLVDGLLADVRRRIAATDGTQAAVEAALMPQTPATPEAA